MEFAQDMGFLKVWFESDAQAVIKRIKAINLELSQIGAIIDEARARMKIFPMCSIQHISREANMATHCLAGSALNSYEDRYWIEDCPYCIISIVESECNSPS
ncbi:hypothetical protein CRYUN_Cryun22dG0028300 [Craigia yunnanensis]